MGGMRRVFALVVLVAVLSACATIPDGAYFPAPSARTKALQTSLYRAAEAAGDDPRRYSFALVDAREIAAFNGEEDGVLYFTDGLAALPPAHMDALVAREVAHEVLGHAAQRRVIQFGVTSTFTVLGFIVPGLSLANWVVNPLIVRAFTREQVIAADVRAIEILRSMGHEQPRRTLASALQRVETTNSPRRGGPLAATPPLTERLAAIGPVEPLPELAQQK